MTNNIIFPNLNELLIWRSAGPRSTIAPNLNEIVDLKNKIFFFILLKIEGSHFIIKNFILRHLMICKWTVLSYLIFFK
jgi:hypothetical protein